MMSSITIEINKHQAFNFGLNVWCLLIIEENYSTDSEAMIIIWPSTFHSLIVAGIKR